jgi:hypothetical protein
MAMSDECAAIERRRADGDSMWLEERIHSIQVLMSP